jgi:hypothetical protein
MRLPAIALAILAGGCAFRRGDPLPEEPPADFSLEVRVDALPSSPWTGSVRFEAPGEVAYDVLFADPPSNRRGREALDPAALREAWSAARASGFFDREPVPDEEVAGPVVVEGRALGLEGRRCGDPAADPALAELLDAVRRAAPARVLRPIPGN